METADIITVERYALADDVPVRYAAPHVMGTGLAGELGSLAVVPDGRMQR